MIFAGVLQRFCSIKPLDRDNSLILCLFPDKGRFFNFIKSF